MLSKRPLHQAIILLLLSSSQCIESFINFYAHRICIFNHHCDLRYLFDLLTNQVVNKKQIPIVVVCNKSEMITAKPKEFVKEELEMEM